MMQGPNQVNTFTVAWPGAGNVPFSMFLTDGNGTFGITTAMNFTWAEGPEDSVSIFAGEKPFVISPGAGLPIWFLGDVYVGMSYGGRNLYVRGTIHQGEDRQPVPVWRGRLSSDPAAKNPGDTYWNTTTSKARMWNGTAWIDLN